MTVTAQKKCPQCRTTKPLSEYYTDRTRANGVTCRCKTCIKNNNKKYYHGKRNARIEPVNTIDHERVDNIMIQTGRLQSTISGLQKDKKLLLQELSSYERLSTFIASVESATQPSIVIEPARRMRQRNGIAVALLSDHHVGEVVDPDLVNRKNQYNVDIYKMRIQRLWEGVINLISINSQIFDIRDLVLWLGGDLVSGSIHEELEESNELTPEEAVVLLLGVIQDGIAALLHEYPKLRIKCICNHGNHGRSTKKLRIATSARHSYEHLLYVMLASQCHSDRVTWQISRASHTYASLAGHTVRFMHGHQSHYNNGIGGPTVTLNKLIYRLNQERHADLTCLGHLHQYMPGTTYIVNGSLIGYNTFAAQKAFAYEPPSQAFFMIDQKRGVCMQTPIWCNSDEERNNEE
jgi:hypothetical protein